MSEVIYSPEFVDWYDRVYYTDSITRREVKLLESILKNKQKILDVGCGTGRHARLLAKKHQVTGIDVSKAMIAYARKKCKKAKFLVMSMQNINLKDKFDAAIMMGSTFPYLTKDSAINNTLRGIWRVLNNKGIFILAVNINNKRKNFKKRIFWKDMIKQGNKILEIHYDMLVKNKIFWVKTTVYRKIGDKILKPLKDAKFVSRRSFTTKEILNFLKKQGFLIKQVMQFGRQKIFVSEKSEAST
ncbi:MAG: class I SAM-dependent methyltransferase [Candidatus Woesearchaeota archaeon]